MIYGNLALAVAALLLSSPGGTRSTLHPVTGPDDEPPHLRVWVDQENPYQQGASARVYFSNRSDSYMTIVRIDTEGRIRVLFPIEPWEDNYSRGGKTFEVLGRSEDAAFRIDDAPGIGYIFAISSPDPFTYDEFTRGDHWDYRAISDGRVRGDPYVAATDLAGRISPDGDYDYDVAEYYVERHYDYPRFVCNDCHGYATNANWDPYDSFCSRFRVVIYDDPYYYPYRRYGSRAVVVARPHNVEPRYVFKEYDGRNDYVTRVAQHPRNDAGDVRADERSNADAGARNQVAAPVIPRDRATPGDRPSETGRAPSPTRERINSDRARTPADETTRTPRTESAEKQRVVDPSREAAKAPRTEPAVKQRKVDPRREPATAPRTEPAEKQRKADPRRDPAKERGRETVRTRPAPRSTGEPELRRRRPN